MYNSQDTRYFICLWNVNHVSQSEWQSGDWREMFFIRMWRGQKIFFGLTQLNHEYSCNSTDKDTTLFSRYRTPVVGVKILENMLFCNTLCFVSPSVTARPSFSVSLSFSFSFLRNLIGNADISSASASVLHYS